MQEVKLVVATFVAESSWSIPFGTPVFDVVGEKLGTVRDADLYNLAVEEGLLIITTYMIPMAFVERFEDGALHLNVTKAEVAGNSGVQ
jgi:hypothetical protein